MTGGNAPSSGIVQAIVNTVAKSVQGLTADNVVVTDDQGHVLAGAADSADSAAAQAKDLIEQQTETKIETLLDAALGPGHASVAVSAEVNSSQIQQDVTTYAAAGSNPPVSISQNIEQYGATASSGACGVPGSDSNVAGLSSYPGVCPAANTTAAPTAASTATPSATASASPGSSAPAAAATPTSSAAAGTGYSHVQTTINYSVSETVQHIVTQPGVVTKLSVAVFVDKAALGSLTADTLKTSIAAAIGSDSTRGDVVAVQAIAFAAQPTAGTNAASSATGDIVKTVGSSTGTILGAVFALVMLALFWMNLSALRRKAEDVYDLGPAGSTPAFAPVPNRAGIPASTNPDAPAAADVPNATPQARIQERLRMVADERPDALAGLMHGWLREDTRR
jgi:flagellar M-ring protein FliF